MDRAATFILIHGAYLGGWSWKFVAERLEAAGHRVFRPSLDGCAERRHDLRPGITTETHGREIADLLHYEDLANAVLVGTSSGGMVLCRAAETIPERVGGVVFVDALALQDGERIDDIVDRPPGESTELATGPSIEDMNTRLFADLDADQRRWAVERCTPHPIAAMEDPVRLESFWDLPWDATVVHCRRSTNPPEAHQRRTAELLGGRWLELDTGHYPMLSTPDDLAQILLDVAPSVPGTVGG